MESKVYFNNSKGDKICGILSNPDLKKILPIIILCHGLNSGKESFTNIALDKILSEHNIATFRFDFFSHGESEGKIEDRSLEEFVDDILRAIDYLKKQGFKKFGIQGSSFGGVAAVIAASRNSDIKIMTLKATGMGQTSRKMPNYKKDFENKTWIKAGKNVTIPALIIHGTEDVDVEVEFGKELAKSIKNSRLELFQDADHRFSKKEDFDRSIKVLSDFIIENIAKA